MHKKRNKKYVFQKLVYFLILGMKVLEDIHICLQILLIKMHCFECCFFIVFLIMLFNGNYWEWSNQSGVILINF